MITLTQQIIDEIMHHTEVAFPNEVAGVIVQEGKRMHYFPLRNVSETPTEASKPDPDDFIKAAQHGTIIAYVHSHTGDGATTLPSIADRAECNSMGYAYVITSWPEGDLRILMPEKLPLVGRPWCLGFEDCWSLVMAFHAEYGIKLHNYCVDREWWKEGGNLYDDNWEQEGFVLVRRPPRYGDMIMMCLQSEVTNHAGLFLGGNQFLHHYSNRLSKVDPYGGYFRDHTTRIVRHKDLPEDIEVLEELKVWSK